MTRLTLIGMLATTALPGAAFAADPELPAFDAASFADGMPNPFVPLTPGYTTTMIGTRATGEVETDVMLVVGPGPQIMGVKTTLVQDDGYDGDLLVERTLDYYATDAAGNLWYFGEDVTNYEYDDAGKQTGTNSHSSWKAGVNGAEPGISLAGNPAEGLTQFQEHAPADEAMDYSTVIATDLSLTVAGRDYTGVLQTFEASLSEPDLREYKYYAPGVGMIRAEEELSEGLDNPAIVLDLRP